MWGVMPKLSEIPGEVKDAGPTIGKHDTLICRSGASTFAMSVSKIYEFRPQPTQLARVLGIV